MIDEVLAIFPDARKTNNGWEVRCPAHDDTASSLSIAVGEQGNVLLKCFAGCSFNDIVDATKLPKAAFFGPKNGRNGESRQTSRPSGSAKREKKKLGAIEKIYDYVDEAGNLLSQAIRYAPDADGKKEFRQRRPDPDTPAAWIWSLGNTRRVLYRLPELLAADPRRTVIIVEGEKDADRLVSLGCVATCNVMGAGKWRDDYNESLRGRPVVVIPDNDGAGVDHALTIAESLIDVASEVKILRLPGVPIKGDVSDWLDAGGTIEQLRELVNATNPYAPGAPTENGDGISDLADRFIARLEPAWRRKCVSLFSVKLNLEIPLPSLWTHLTPEEINAVKQTAEGREMIRNNKAPGYRQRVAALRDAVRLAAGKALPDLPDQLDAAVNHELNSEDLESIMIAWLFKDRTCRKDTGNPVSLTYYAWATGCRPGEGWLACYNTSVYARMESADAQPGIAAQGDLLTEQLRQYESKRALARDLRQAGLADTDTTIRVDGRVLRAWLIDAALIERAAGRKET